MSSGRWGLLTDIMHGSRGHETDCHSADHLPGQPSLKRRLDYAIELYQF